MEKGKVTIRDVAAQANVSISTVSRYLADPSRIRPASAQAIREAIRSLGFIPNPFAQGLKRNTSRVVRVIIPDIANSFFSIACKTIGSFFYEHGYSIMICDTDEDPVKEQFYLEDGLQNHAAGILLATTGGNTQYIRQFLPNYSPLVLFDRPEDLLPIDCVGENNELSAAQLTQRMIDAGQTRFAVLLGNDHSVNTLARLRGVRMMAEQAGITLEPDYVFSNLNSKMEAFQVVQKLLAEDGAPRCILACNPKLLEGAVFAINSGHVEWQKQAVLCGFSIEHPSNIATFPLCTVVQNPAAVALRASELLLNRITSKQPVERCEKILIEANVCGQVAAIERERGARK